MVQIFGTKKCRDTAKTLRFFKERRIEVHFVDLAERNISRGELKNILRSIAPEELIDINSKAYENRNLKYIKHDIEEELLVDPALFRTPIVRSGNRIFVGYDPDAFKLLAGK